MKKILLFLSILFLLFPLLFFIRHGSLVGNIGGEHDYLDLYVIYQTFAPTSLIIGLFLLALYLAKPIKELKDFFLNSLLFLIPLLLLLFMIISTAKFNKVTRDYLQCMNLASSGVPESSIVKLKQSGKSGPEIQAELEKNSAIYEQEITTQMNEVQKKEAQCLDEKGIHYHVNGEVGSGKFNQIDTPPINYFQYLPYLK